MYVIRNKDSKLYLRGKNWNHNLVEDINKARVFKNKQSASCAWTWATYGSANYLNSEILEINLTIKQ